MKDGSDGGFTERQRRALQQLADEQIRDWPTRRQALAGAAGIGGLGFFAGRTSADASTSDGDGNVGTPSSRIDVFADGVDAHSLTDASSGNTYDIDDLAGGSASTGTQIDGRPYPRLEERHVFARSDVEGTRQISFSGDIAAVSARTPNTLTILDVRNPLEPLRIGHIEDNTNLVSVRKVEVSSTHAFTVTGHQSDGWLASWNITDPKNPSFVSQISPTGVDGAWDIYLPDDGTAIIANHLGNEAATGGITSVDVSDPSSMSVLQRVQDSDIDAAMNVEPLSSDNLVVTGYNNNSILTYDVSNPSNMSRLDGVVGDSDLNGARNLAIVGDYAYVVGRLSDAFTIWDCSDPENISKTATFTDADLSTLRSVASTGEVAYVAGENGLITSIDVSDKTAPAKIETHDVVDNAASNRLNNMKIHDNALWVCGLEGGANATGVGIFTASETATRSLTGGVLRDDWGDNALTNRDGITETATTGRGENAIARYRPEWTTDNGSPAAASQELQLPAGSSTTQILRAPIDVDMNGRWTWVFNFSFSSIPTNNGANVTLAAASTSTTGSRYSDSFNLSISNSGLVALWRTTSGGSNNQIFGDSNAWPVDTASHTATVVRSGDGSWRVLVDGSVVGTGTQEDTPAVSHVGVGNTSDAQFNVDNLRVE